MSIKVENLTKIYGKQHAVDHVSFDISAGEIVGFLGPNGAGKSTTMKILTGYLQQTSGYAEVAGFDVNKHPEESRRHIGYLPELNPLYTEMYVREYLRFIATVQGLGKNAASRVEEMIEKTGLGKECHKKIHQLSKGYKQRVGLAQAMIHNPEVLILDEPTSGLDPNQITEIRRLITAFGKDRTILLSTHIMQEVKAMCNRVIIINKGKIAADGTVDELQQQFSGKQLLTVKFKHAANKKEIEKINGVIKVDFSEPESCLIETIPDTEIKEKLFAFAVASNNVILELSEKEQSLEEVFQQLTQ